MVDGLQHPADLALAAFSDGELDLVVRDPPDLGRERSPVLELHTVPQAPQVALLQSPFHARPIRTRHLVTRMHEAVGELAVVRDEDQAGRLGVQAADGIEPLAAGYEGD